MLDKTMIPLSKIVADKNQPRKYFDTTRMATLETSIKEMGIRNPLIVEKQGANYLIIDGERRFRAATKLKLKEVPAVVIESKDPISRLVEQFHIQEQHEGWTPAEKASVLIQLANETKKSISEVSNILGIPQRTASTYMAIGRLTHQSDFIKLNVPLSMATAIDALKKRIKVVYEETNNEAISKKTLDDIEKETIRRIAEGEIETPRNVVRIKDSLTSDLKYIKTYLEGKLTIDEIWIKSKGRAMGIVRTIGVQSAYMSNNIARMMEDGSIALTKDQIISLRSLYKRMKELARVVDID